MTLPFIIGIDPGSPITMALLSPSGGWIAHAFENTVADKVKVGWANSPSKTFKVLTEWQEFAQKYGGTAVGVIENVGPRPGEGILSAAKFAGSVWMTRSLLTAMGIPYVMVAPKKWKRALKLDKDKDKSVKLARELFPARAWRLEHKKDHDLAEAALLAWYYRSTLVTGL